MHTLFDQKNQFLLEFKAFIESKLSKISKNPNLLDWAKYTLLSGGKRLRPLMTFFASNCNPKSFDTALCIELIHTYSLIHDDLPAMDDDPLRRGKASLHKYANEAGAILTGDMLLTFAFEVISTCKSLSYIQKNRIVTLLSKASGGTGLIQGQILDLFEKQATKLDLLTLYEKKTSALFMVALEAGSVINGHSLKEQKLFRKIGLHFGVAFQLLDDIVDNSETLKLFSKNEIKSLYILQRSKTLQLLEKVCNPHLTDLCLNTLTL